MTIKTPDHKQDSETVSDRRRKLLLASAAAPIVATLQSGAAWATASAFQCIGGEVSNFKLAIHGNSLSGDNAVRVNVPYYNKIRGRGRGRGISGSQHVFLIDETYYNNSGDEFQGDPDNDLELMGEAYVLVLYSPNSDNTCVKKVGLWPKVQVSDVNIPLNGTCLTSIAVSDSCNIL